MRIVSKKAELWKQGSTLDEIWDHIARCTRVCYQSTPKNKDENSQEFCLRTILANKHYAMLEHGTIYLTIALGSPIEEKEYILKSNLIRFFQNNIYSKVKEHSSTYYITTNMRVIIENKEVEIPKEIEEYTVYTEILTEAVSHFISEPTEFHEKRHTIYCITDRGVWNEIIRNRSLSQDDDFWRDASFAQESTRFCNYSKDRFNNELQFIAPEGIILNTGRYEFNVVNSTVVGDGYLYDVLQDEETPEGEFIINCLDAEESYFNFIDKFGFKPQIARQLLNNALKTSIVITAYESDWNHFFDLRLKGTTGKPHPDMVNLAQLIYNEYTNR